jgi:hypothetical protein
MTAGCLDLSIPGIELPVQAADRSVRAVGPPPAGASLVTVVRGRSLVYLGSFAPDGPVAMTLDDVRQRLTGGPVAAGSMVEASGILVGDDPPRYLSMAGEDNGIEPPTGTVVDVPADAPGIDPAVNILVGTFLVARTDDPADWLRIVARYVPSRAVRVLVP